MFMLPVVLVVAGVAVFAVKASLVFKTARAIQQPPRGVAVLPQELEGLTVERIEYSLEDGLRVRAWYLPSQNGAALLLVHGQPGTRTELVAEAKALSQHGYGVLLIDLPGHGESEGQPTWGKSARQAVSRALDYLSQRCEVDPKRLGVFGFSYGAALVARVATEERRLRGVVLAGVYTSARDQIEHGYKKWGVLTQWPALLGSEWDGLALDDLKPTDTAAKIAPTPVLVVAGTADIVVPYSMSRTIFELAEEPKDFFTVEGAGHGEYAKLAATAYFERLTSFFDGVLVPSGARAPNQGDCGRGEGTLH